MRCRKILTVKRDAQSQELGLVFDEMKINPDLFMASSDPLLIAHDLLEHPNGIKAIGTIHDEFEALGGVIFVRGYTQQLRKDRIGSAYTFEESIANDLVRMARELSYVECKKYAGHTKAINAARDCAYGFSVENCMEEILIIAKEKIPREFNDKKEMREILGQWTIDSYLKNAKHFVRAGYRKTWRRFNGDARYANDLFWHIVEKADIYCKNLSYEGEQFLLTIEGERVYFDEYYSEDYNE